MKKIILLSLMLTSLPCALFADDAEDSALVANTISVKNGNPADPCEDMKPYPTKTFGLSIDNQTKLLNRLLAEKKICEVVRYFLSLQDHDSKKALEILGKDGNEDLRLVILENLSTEAFEALLCSLSKEIGGQAIEHWAYIDSDIYAVTKKMIPSVRAQQYVNFYMRHKTWQKTIYQTTYDNKELLKVRGQKIAEVLNQMDLEKAMELLYGRLDMRFVVNWGRIVPGNGAFFLNINDTNYVYEAWEKKRYENKESWVTKNKEQFDEQSSPSQVMPKWINYIVPHLKAQLITSIFEKENKNILKELIASVGCEKLFNELFEHFEDAVKDSVFESCNEDDLLFDMLGLESENNNGHLPTENDNVLQLGAESENKEKDEI